jgi:hypothetical protein
VTPGLILAEASDRKIRRPGKCSQQGDETARKGSGHFTAIPAGKRAPARLGKWLGPGPVQQSGAGREIRQPHIEIVFTGIIGFPDPPRRPAHGAYAGAFVPPSRRAEPYDPYSQLLGLSNG